MTDEVASLSLSEDSSLVAAANTELDRLKFQLFGSGV